MEKDKQIHKDLENKVRELEKELEKKNLEAEFLNKMIDIGKDKYGMDLRGVVGKDKR